MTAARSRSLTVRISVPMAVLRRVHDLLLDGIQFRRRQFLLPKKRQNQFARRPGEKLCEQVMDSFPGDGVPINLGCENESAPLLRGRKVALRLENPHQCENGGV